MTMIYDPIPSVELVQQILVGNYKPTMGICVKIFIINLHNLQMLFMLWIKYKFSECLAPGQTWGPPKEPKPTDTGNIRGQLPPLFLPPKFCFAQKILF